LKKTSLRLPQIRGLGFGRRHLVDENVGDPVIEHAAINGLFAEDQDWQPESEQNSRTRSCDDENLAEWAFGRTVGASEGTRFQIELVDPSCAGLSAVGSRNEDGDFHGGRDDLPVYRNEQQ
jgi:hypothetical protein